MAILLAITYLSVYVSPVNFWPLAIYSLAYKYFLFLNIIFVVFWAVSGKRYFVISLLVIILGWNSFLNTFQFPLFKKTLPDLAENAKPIKVLSYNVQLFNLFSWSDKGSQQGEVIDFIEINDPDIICFQEFYTTGYDDHSIKYFNEKLKNYPYRHIFFLTKNSGNKNYGMAIYSKHKILSRVKHKFNDSYNTSIYSDIQVGNDTIRLFNNHLQSVRLSHEDHRFLDSLMLNPENRIDGFKNISYRLKEAFVKRVEQMEEINKIVSETDYPVIICGDFNDTPISYVYHQIRSGMYDAFVESGNGNGVSFTGRKPFDFRIDFILYNDSFISKNFQTHKIDFSDHYPISCELYLK